jgi:hypothetical protein
LATVRRSKHRPRASKRNSAAKTPNDWEHASVAEGHKQNVSHLTETDPAKLIFITSLVSETQQLQRVTELANNRSAAKPLLDKPPVYRCAFCNTVLPTWK